MTSQEEIDKAEAEGKTAGKSGDTPFSANPYGGTAQGSPKRVLSIAWRRGYRAGEIEADDAGGDLFRGQVKA